VNHPDEWTDPYDPTDSLADAGFINPGAPGNGQPTMSDSLLTALSYPGGPGVAGGERILLKQAVAAVLNAAHPDINYPLGDDPAAIVAVVNAALAANSRSGDTTLAGTLDGYNNLHNNDVCG
jgi:hypothetical protein